MTQVLEIGLSNALAATGLAFLVALGARFCRQPQAVFCLWLLVLIKLVTPPLFEVPLPLLASGRATSVAPSVPVSQPALQPAANATKHLPFDGAHSSKNTHRVPADSTLQPSGDGVGAVQRATKIDWRQCVGVIWILGALTYLALVAQRQLVFERLLRLTTRAPQELCEAALHLSQTMQLRSRPRIRVTASNVSPLVWCLTPAESPVVVLPQTLLSRLSAEQQSSLLAHELAHLRRGDHWVRWFELLVTALFWWHPVVWWARRELHRAGDQCCDAWVLWAFPQAARGYAEALLKTIDFLAEAGPAAPSVASTIGQARFLERRIRMILRQIPSRDMTRTSQLLLMATALLVLPISSRLVAQVDTDSKSEEKPSATRPQADAAEKADAAALKKGEANAEDQPKAEIPKAGILAVEITIGDRTTTAKNVKAAMTQLGVAARRVGQGEGFSAAINVNGTTREFDNVQQAATACTTLGLVLDSLKKSQIHLGELGPIEPVQVPANRQEPRPVVRRGRDGDDGLGARGGLGGTSGGALALPFNLPAVGGAGSKDQKIALFRGAIAQLLIENNRRQPQDNSDSSAYSGVDQSGQATLFGRLAHGDYEKATFSFEFALRDDPSGRIGNDWDLQYGSVPNHFHVTMVSDDRSRIVDLGEMDFDQVDLDRLPKLPASPSPQRDFVPAVVGRVYLVHTVDRNTDLHALFRVERLNQNQSCDISWKRLAAPKKAELQAQP